MAKLCFSSNVLAVGLLLSATHAIAVDPVTLIKPEVSAIHQRFTLIGVISEGGGNSKGVAVIKDHVAGKSLTIKVGDEVLQNSNLRLTEIKKNRAILAQSGESWVITYEVVDRSKPTLSTDSEDSLMNENGQITGVTIEKLDESDPDYNAYSNTRKEFANEPGLFERWYSNLKLKEYSSKHSGVIAPNGESVSRRVDYEDPQIQASDLQPVDLDSENDEVDVLPLTDDDLKRRPARRIDRD